MPKGDHIQLNPRKSCSNLSPGFNIQHSINMKFPFSAESVTFSEDFPRGGSLMVHPSVGITGLSELSLRSALDLNCIKYLIFFFFAF